MKGNFRKKLLVTVGSLAILTGILFNEWTLATFSPHIRELFTRREIWGINALCVTVGFLLIKYRHYIKLHEIIFSAITFMIFLLLLEGGLRTFYFVKNKVIPRERNFSEYLGWATKPNDYRRGEVKGYGEIVYSTTKFGFRRFGDVNTHKTKIFVLGDSFSQCRTVSDGKTYYDYLRENSDNIEIFAYGCGGYGSLQEYMVLDKYFDIINPDIVLWQFCNNDIIDNSRELEYVTIRGQCMTRPYYIDGRIEWVYPTRNFGFLYNIIQSSYLLRLLNIKLDILKGELIGVKVEELSENDPLFKKAVDTTSEIMDLVRKRVDNVPIVAFLAGDNPKWLGNTFSDICSKYSIYYIQGIPEALEDAKQHGVVVDGSPYNRHWNDTGNSITGRIILDYLVRNNLLNNQKFHMKNGRQL